MSEAEEGCRPHHLIHCTQLKEPGNLRADGKILKSPGWQGPEIARILRAQGWQG